MFDFLKPKWKRSDPNARIEGIGKICEITVLEYLKNNDPEPNVRQFATDRITEIKNGERFLLSFGQDFIDAFTEPPIVLKKKYPTIPIEQIKIAYFMILSAKPNGISPEVVNMATAMWLQRLIRGELVIRKYNSEYHLYKILVPPTYL